MTTMLLRLGSDIAIFAVALIPGTISSVGSRLVCPIVELDQMWADGIPESGTVFDIPLTDLHPNPFCPVNL